jgi:hypothetical protein
LIDQMEQENPTGGDTGASTLDRLESFLSADTAPKKPAASDAQPSSTDNELQDVDDSQPQADDAQDATEDPDKADVPAQGDEKPNEYQLSDIAKLLGADESALDVDEDGNVLVKTKVDGQEGKAKFADLIKSYQLQSHVDKQVREVAEQRKAVQEQAQSLQQQLQVQQAVIGKIAEVKAIESELALYQNIDWQALADQDPQRAVKLDLQMRDLQRKHAQTIGQVNEAGQHIQQKQTEQMQAALVIERQALLAALPEWNDPTKVEKDRAEIKADLKARGYSDADIDGLRDHKAVLLARDAMLYRKMKAATSATEKVVRAAPKIIKPGTSQSGSRQTTNVQNLKTTVRKSGGSGQSVVDYLIATGKA